jgi:hypothetical protein
MFTKRFELELLIVNDEYLKQINEQILKVEIMEVYVLILQRILQIIIIVLDLITGIINNITIQQQK